MKKDEFDDTDNYFCLASDGLIWSLGNHGDFEAASDTADSLCLKAIWIFGEQSARNWMETLQSFLTKENV